MVVNSIYFLFLVGLLDGQKPTA